MKENHEHIIGFDLGQGLLILEDHLEDHGVFINDCKLVIVFRYCPIYGEKIQKEKYICQT